MKKVMIVLVAAMLLLLVGCDNDGIYVIRERHFVNQIDNIFMNHNRYLGRTIQFEGMFGSYVNPETGAPGHYTYRYTYGCCGDDGLLGFGLVLGEINPVADNSWVEVTGVLEEDGQFLVLNVISLIELEERGAEFVF